MALNTIELFELFEKVCEDAVSFAQLSVRRPNHPSSESVSQIRYAAEKSVKQAMVAVETQPLIVPILSGAMKHITDMYAVSMRELLSGEFAPKRARYELLMTELDNSHIALEWDSTNKKISEIIQRLGLRPDPELLNDMPRVAEIMLNAFDFFGQYHTDIIKVAAGRSSDDRPFLIRSMPRFSTTGEFYDFFNKVPTNSAIMVAAITPTYTQTKDSIGVWENEVSDKYRHRHSFTRDERIHNMSKSDPNFDPDTAVDNHLSRIAVGVKRGENIWLIIHSDESSTNGKFLNYHGNRTSFMPFQVLFKDAPVPNNDCTDLALPMGSSWNLLSLLDNEQALWLPTFLWLVEKKYFSATVDNTEQLVYLPDMVQVKDGNANTSLPAVRKTLTVDIDPFTVPEELEYVTGPETDEFIKHLSIVKEDLAGAVFTPRKNFGDEKTYFAELWYMQRSALAHLAKAKLMKDFWDNSKELYTFLSEAIENNRSFLLEELEKPESIIHSITTHVIDKQPHVKGGEIVTKIGRYGYGIDAEIMLTTIDLTRKQRHSHHAVICVPPTLYGKRPPVCISLDIKSPEELSFATGISVNELPWQFLMAGKAVMSHVSPFGQGRHDPMMVLDNPYKRFPGVNIAMGKKEYKEIFPDKILSKAKIAELLAEVEAKSAVQKAEMNARAKANEDKKKGGQ